MPICFSIFPGVSFSPKAFDDELVCAVPVYFAYHSMLCSFISQTFFLTLGLIAFGSVVLQYGLVSIARTEVCRLL